MFEVDAAMIRRKVADSGLTAKEFAERAELNAMTVTRLINGNTTRASIKVLGKLAKALGVDSETLILKKK